MSSSASGSKRFQLQGETRLLWVLISLALKISKDWDSTIFLGNLFYSLTVLSEPSSCILSPLCSGSYWVVVVLYWFYYSLSMSLLPWKAQNGTGYTVDVVSWMLNGEKLPLLFFQISSWGIVSLFFCQQIHFLIVLKLNTKPEFLLYEFQKVSVKQLYGELWEPKTQYKYACKCVLLCRHQKVFLKCSCWSRAEWWQPCCSISATSRISVERIQLIQRNHIQVMPQAIVAKIVLTVFA